MVGEGLGLGAGGQLLAGVLVERVLLGLGLEVGLGRHRDALHGQLVVHLVVDEDVRPGQQAARHQEDGDQQQAGTRR